MQTAPFNESERYPAEELAHLSHFHMDAVISYIYKSLAEISDHAC